ncbi:glycosyl transferase family 17 protein, partial [Magnaporthiopsis poae ATCC 64411]
MRSLLPRRLARRARPLFVLTAFCALLVFFWSGGGALRLSPHRISNHGLYSQSESDASLCRRHGWRPFRPPGSFSWWWPFAQGTEQARARKVYDLFMINNEIEWLEVRLNTTYDYVDYFVVVEAPLTFTGLPKPLVIKENWDRLRPYHAKLFYHELQYPPNYNPPRPWDREDLQRDASLEQALPRLAAEVPGA